MREMIRLQQSEQSAECVCKANGGAGEGISTERRREKEVRIELERHCTPLTHTDDSTTRPHCGL